MSLNTRHYAHALGAALIDTIVGLMIALFSFSRDRLRVTF